MDWLRVASLVVYTFGAFAYGAIVVVSLARLGRPAWAVGEARACAQCAPNDAVGGTLTVVSFLWFAANLVMALVGEEATPSALWALFVGTVFLFPPLVMHIVFAESAPANPRLAGGWWMRAVWLMYAATQAVSAATVLAVYGVVRLPWPSALTGLWIGGFFLLTAIFCSIVLVRAARPQESRDERASRRWMLGLFVFIMVAFLPMTMWSATRDRMGDVLDVVGRSMPLAFLFVGTYYESRFEFFDLMVKRGLSLLVTLALLAAWFGLAAPWLATEVLAWAGPWAPALGLLPLAMGLPWLHRRLGDWLDEAWFGRQFTTVEAVKRFLVGLNQATTEAELVGQARTGIAAIMRAPVAIELGSSPEAPPFESVLDVASPRDARGGVIRLGRRRDHRPYFSEDVALVATLGEVFTLMLEHVRLQAGRREQDHRARELSLEASRSELKALRAQINPHFLFNALNAIAGLIHEDPARADRAVEQLAEVFRYTLRRSETEWARLEDEADLARAYLDVEQARFGSRLAHAIDIAPEVRDRRVPTMMLQTLVENAVKHGVSAVRGQGRVEIRARADGDRLRIEVADNGPGFDPAARGAAGGGEAPAGGYGLRIVAARLGGCFGAVAALERGRDASRGLTVVAVLLPLEHAHGGAPRHEGVA